MLISAVQKSDPVIHIYMCVSVYIYVCVYMCIYMYVYVCVYMCIYVYMCMYVYMYIQSVHARACVCV